eukprot:4783995-Pleurochrysis_carterae.AAC.2
MASLNPSDAKNLQIVIRLLAACVGHPAVVHVIDAVPVGAPFVKVARIEFGLLEPLDLHKLFLGRSVPDSARVGLAVQGFQELPHCRDSAIVEEAFVGWRLNVYLSVVAVELALEVCGLDVKLSN